MISVTMPAFNAETFIAEAIESILAQSFGDFELIISDDGSTDGTLDIAQSYAARDGRVRVIRTDHVGVSENGNLCLRAARFPWIARMDADDISLPDRLEVLAEAAQANPEVVLWGGYAQLIDRWGNRLRQVRIGPTSSDEFNEYRRSGGVIYVCSPTCLFRRDLALELGGYDGRLKASVDVDLMNRMAEHGEVRVVPRDLAFYRIHGGSISSTKAILQKRTYDFLIARNRARLEGRDLDVEEFFRKFEQQSLLPRLLAEMGDFGRMHYNRMVVHLAERRMVQAVGSAGLAALCNPGYTFQRAGSRLLSNYWPTLGRGLAHIGERRAVVPHGTPDQHHQEQVEQETHH